MATLYPLEIHTPYRQFYAGNVEALIVRLIDGDIGLYANHSFFVAPTCAGIVKIKDNTGKWLNAFATEGILEVKGHKTVLLIDVAEWPEEIDYERALAEKKQAEERIAESSMKFEANNAKISLAHANERIRAYTLRKTAE
jgi:F-type H+-transporting ATPase subunit epsilon